MPTERDYMRAYLIVGFARTERDALLREAIAFELAAERARAKIS